MRGHPLVIVSRAAAAALLTASATLGAQEPVRVGSRLVPHVAVSGALDLRNGESRFPAMYLGLASLEWGTAIPGLGARLEGLYASRSRENRLYPDCGFSCSPPPDNNSLATYSSKVSAKGVLIAATYEIVRQGAFRPYVLGGVGAVQTHDESITGTIFLCSARFCTTSNPAGGLTLRDERPISGAAHIGVGTVYTWRWVSVMGEVRYFAVTNGVSRGLNGALPVSLGVRF